MAKKKLLCIHLKDFYPSLMHDNQQVLEYWEKDEVESMYDKHLLNSEIRLISKYISEGDKVLDAGCGEGEGTLVYSGIEGTIVHGADFSKTRLKKASERLNSKENVALQEVDFLKDYDLDDDYDVVVSQRFLINLMEWELQKKVLLDLMGMLKKGGKLLMLEGSKNGVDELNTFRGLYNLAPIPVKWHNLFFDDEALADFMAENGFKLITEDGLGAYILLTRGIRPFFEEKLNWDCEFNEISASENVNDTLGLGAKCSRLKLWVFEK